MENELIIKHVRLTFDEWNKTIQKKQAFLYEDMSMRYSLIELLQVEKKQIWNVFGGRVIVADSGYKWLVISPKHENYVITMYLNEKMQPVLWYIDIIDGIGTDSDGVFYYNDMFLDIIVSEQYQLLEDDRDELELALERGIISNEQYKLVNKTAAELIKRFESEPQWILNLCQDVLEELLKKIEEGNCVLYK